MFYWFGKTPQTTDFMWLLTIMNLRSSLSFKSVASYSAKLVGALRFLNQFQIQCCYSYYLFSSKTLHYLHFACAVQCTSWLSSKSVEVTKNRHNFLKRTKVQPIVNFKSL